MNRFILTTTLLVSAPDSPTLDAWLSTKAHIALAVSHATTRHVRADTEHAVVTLFGTVPTSEDRALAQGVVAAIKGVRRVQNDLAVVPEKYEQIVQAYDDVVMQSAKEALAASPLLKTSAIHVGNVSAGVVTLAGSAEDVAEHATAVDAVTRVAGVRSVDSRVNVKNDAPVTTFYYPTVGIDLSSPLLHDMWLTMQVKERLLGDADVPVFDVRVDTVDRVVTLYGVVASAREKVEAEACARSVKGVLRVEDLIEVDATLADTKPKPVSDRELTARVRRLLNEDGASDLHVDVRKGVVKLSGKVGSEERRAYIGFLTRGATGARAVKNAIEVEHRVRAE